MPDSGDICGEQAASEVAAAEVAAAEGAAVSEGATGAEGVAAAGGAAASEGVAASEVAAAGEGGADEVLSELPTSVAPQSFERNWGQRLLAGTGFVLFIAGVVLVAYFAWKMVSVGVYADVADWLVSMGRAVYGVGLAAGVLLLPPGVLAVLVAKRPQHAVLAVGVGIFGLVLVVCFVIAAFVLDAGSAATILVVGVLLAIAPAVYLAASVKVLRAL